MTDIDKKAKKAEQNKRQYEKRKLKDKQESYVEELPDDTPINTITVPPPAPPPPQSESKNEEFYTVEDLEAYLDMKAEEIVNKERELATSSVPVQAPAQTRTEENFFLTAVKSSVMNMITMGIQVGMITGVGLLINSVSNYAPNTKQLHGGNTGQKSKQSKVQQEEASEPYIPQQSTLY